MSGNGTWRHILLSQRIGQAPKLDRGRRRWDFESKRFEGIGDQCALAINTACYITIAPRKAVDPKTWGQMLLLQEDHTRTKGQATEASAETVPAAKGHNIVLPLLCCTSAGWDHVWEQMQSPQGTRTTPSRNRLWWQTNCCRTGTAKGRKVGGITRGGRAFAINGHVWSSSFLSQPLNPANSTPTLSLRQRHVAGRS